MIPKIFDQMRAANLRLLKLMFLVSIVLGAIEGFFGRLRYSADAINYLDMVRALHAGNWRLAFNPYWGLGYPLSLSLVTALFPSSPAGEWFAVHLFNLFLLAATFVTFYWLVWTLARSERLKWMVADPGAERLLLTGAFAIFLSIELSMDNVSRVGPDMLVACLVFAACALLIKLGEEPGGFPAIALGLVLGVGYVTKSIFLPLTLVFSLVVVLSLWKKQRALWTVFLMLLATGLLAVPYIAGMSWSAGHLTLGDSGSLNYAWNVNKLEPGGLWQGQPPGFGTPIHPAQMVSADPHVYVFSGPFPVTFGPFFNSPYYYRGFRSFFRLKNQIHEAGGNVKRLLLILVKQFVIFALILCLLIGRSKSETKNKTGLTSIFWPLFLVAFAATSAYLLVFVEARYISAFLALVLLALLFQVVAQFAASGRNSYTWNNLKSLSWILAAGCVCTLLVNQKDSDRDVLGHLRRGQYFANDEQWKAGLYLQRMGLAAGDKVAVMSDLVSATRSNWAYMDHLQIVGILGGSLLESYSGDSDEYWHAAPERHASMLDPFREAGARIVVSKANPAGQPADGWETIPGTSLWMYRFRPEASLQSKIRP